MLIRRCSIGDEVVVKSRIGCYATSFGSYVAAIHQPQVNDRLVLKRSFDSDLIDSRKMSLIWIGWGGKQKPELLY